MDIIAGIVTYNPDIARLKKNIDSIKKQVYEVVIVDNNSSNLIEIKKYVKDNINIIENDDNYGIAKALNQIMKYAKDKKIKWVLTLDQDSICPQDFIRRLGKKIQSNVAIVCPNVYDINKKNILKDSIKNKNNYVEKCITSGSLISVLAWEQVGKFDEKMFIDGVDFEFCYRLKDYGYYIYRDDDTELIHEIGHISIRKFLFWKVCVKNHSAFRKYYIAKNIIYVAKKRKKNRIKAVFQEVKLVGIVMFYENDKINKIKKILKGIIDGFKE